MQEIVSNYQLKAAEEIRGEQIFAHWAQRLAPGQEAVTKVLIVVD